MRSRETLLATFFSFFAAEVSYPMKARNPTLGKVGEGVKEGEGVKVQSEFRRIPPLAPGDASDPAQATPLAGKAATTDRQRSRTTVPPALSTCVRQ